MTDKPNISVILPVYNGEDYLERSIRSILEQDFQDFEFLIINDGSLDKTKEIIKSFDNYRIMYIENSKNQGIVRSLNRGLYLSKGKYIARMDSDDYSYSNRLSTQFALFEDQPEIDILSSCIFIKELGEMGNSLTDAQISALLMFCNPLFHPTVMMKAESLKKCKLYYDEKAKHCEDYKLWIDAKISGLKISRCSNVLLEYNFGPGRISHTKSSQQRNNTLIIAYKYACLHFPEFLRNKKHLFYKLLTGHRETDMDVGDLEAFGMQWILENQVLNIFDPLLLSGCINSFLNFSTVTENSAAMRFQN